MQNSQKPRVAIIGIKGFPAIGGASRSSEAIISRLSNSYEFFVYEVTTHKEELHSYNNYQSILFNGIKNSKRINTFLYYLRACFHALFCSNYELIHIQHLYSGFIVPFLRIRYKVITTIHGIIPADDNKWNLIDKLFFKVIEKISLKFSNVAVSVSKPQTILLQRLTTNNIEFIPNGIDIEKYYIEKRVNTNKEYIVFSAARIIKLKGCHTFLKAVKSIGYKNKIKIIGSLDHVPSYKSEIFELSKDLDVEFLGLISDKDTLFNELLTAKYFIFPSTKEGLSNMLLEVASLNIPIICSDIEENKAVFSDDEVLYFKTEDYEDLAQKILYAENNTMDMEKRALKALEILKKDYLWENIAKEYSNLYQKLISSN